MYQSAALGGLGRQGVKLMSGLPSSSRSSSRIESENGVSAPGVSVYATSTYGSPGGLAGSRVVT